MDRNAKGTKDELATAEPGRLPRGGRGSQHPGPIRQLPALDKEVASREGGVDRNRLIEDHGSSSRMGVASREGGVDRNVKPTGVLPDRGKKVASREGGVDRNPEDPRPHVRRSGRRLPRGGVDRNTCTVTRCRGCRGQGVASREGGVDRNPQVSGMASRTPQRVASREGGVDRNLRPGTRWWIGCPTVASREGGVDRNHVIADRLGLTSWAMSPPARGAWIATHASTVVASIFTRCRLPRGGRGSQRSQFQLAHEDEQAGVASREGGVDRNIGSAVPRRWCATAGCVASREGGVDRNALVVTHHRAASALLSPPARGAWIATPAAPYTRARCQPGRRLPRGGRGSQPGCVSCHAESPLPLSPPARGAWIATLSGSPRRR